MNRNDNGRVDLKDQANAVRSKLLRAVEELDRRRHNALDWRLQLRDHAGRVAMVGAAVVAATIVAIALTAHRASAAAERQRLAQRGVLRGRWRAPPPPPRQRGFFAETVRSIAIAALTAGAMIPLRRLAAQIAARPAATPRVH
jgi:hypothetical protein